MQSTIYFLQQELRKARESVTLLQQENVSLKSSGQGENNMTNGLSPHTPPIKKEESEEVVATADDVKPVKTEDSDVCKGARTPPLPPEGSPLSERESVERTERTERRPSQSDLQIDESSSDSAALIIKVENEELSDRDEEEQDNRNINKRTLRTKTNNKGSGKSNGEEVTSARTTRGRDRAKRDKSGAGSDEERTHKKKRRESVLSLDYNEADDDALVLTNGETLQSDPE